MTNLEQLVGELLDNAKDNGYTEFLAGSPQSIAEDMIELTTDCDKYNPDELIPHIEHWQTKQEAQ